MANPNSSLVDPVFANRVRQVQNEVQRRKQAVNTSNGGAYVARLWIRWLDVSVFASNKEGSSK